MSQVVSVLMGGGGRGAKGEVGEAREVGVRGVMEEVKGEVMEEDEGEEMEEVGGKVREEEIGREGGAVVAVEKLKIEIGPMQCRQWRTPHG